MLAGLRRWATAAGFLTEYGCDTDTRWFRAGAVLLNPENLRRTVAELVVGFGNE